MTDLFSLIPDSAMTPEQRRALYRTVPKQKGHFGRPGSGPAGETCTTCRHYYRSHIRSGRSFGKCDRVPETRGAGTDVRAKDDACHGWEKDNG